MLLLSPRALAEDWDEQPDGGMRRKDARQLACLRGTHRERDAESPASTSPAKRSKAGILLQAVVGPS